MKDVRRRTYALLIVSGLSLLFLAIDLRVAFVLGVLGVAMAIVNIRSAR